MWFILACLLVGHAAIETLLHLAFSLSPLNPERVPLYSERWVYTWVLVLSQTCPGIWPFIAKRRVGVAHVIVWAGLGFVCFEYGKRTLWRLRTDYPLSDFELKILAVNLTLLAASGVLAVFSVRRRQVCR